jgi:thioredoxin:protein disulfide reductase
MNRFGIFGPPATLFFDAAGNELRAYRLLGFVPAPRFAEHVLEARRQAGGTP